MDAKDVTTLEEACEAIKELQIQINILESRISLEEEPQEIAEARRTYAMNKRAADHYYDSNEPNAQSLFSQAYTLQMSTRKELEWALHNEDRP